MKDNFEIIRETQKGYTKQPNAILRDPELTSEAKVVIYFLLSLTTGFHLTSRGIAKTVHLSEHKVKKAIELLKRTGYISISRVRDGARYEGWRWSISDISGYFESTDSVSTKTDLTETDRTETVLTDSERTENTPLYELQSYEELRMNKNNIEEPNTELHLHQAHGVVAKAKNPFPSNPSFTANTSSGKNSSTAEPISQKEYLFQQFLKKYPKKPTGTDAAATKQAFLEIPDLENVFYQIMAGLDEWINSMDWNKEGGRYITKPLNFIITQKWEEIPREISTEIDPGLAKFTNKPLEVYL